MTFYAITILAGVIMLSAIVIGVASKVGDKEPKRHGDLKRHGGGDNGLSRGARRDPKALRQASAERIGHPHAGSLPHQRAARSQKAAPPRSPGSTHGASPTRHASHEPRHETRREHNEPARHAPKGSDSMTRREALADLVNAVGTHAGRQTFESAIKKTGADVRPPVGSAHDLGSRSGPPPVAPVTNPRTGPIAPPPLKPAMQNLRQVATNSLNPRNAELEYLIKSRQRIAAIKLYREMTGLSLTEAKQAIEDLERALNI